jgi:hypothetical protein
MAGVDVSTYAEFLDRKRQLANAGGFEPVDLPAHLFDFQTHLVEWAVRQGRGAIFADCGLGKTPMELAWAEQVHKHTGKPVLILTPLAVGPQIALEAQKFGHDAARSRDGSITAGIVVTNYEQLHRFEPADFGGVVCDESSILKSFDGATKAAVTEFMRRIQYRLLATATAAPNDWTELGTSSEALGEMGYVDMLSRFFINKDKTTSSRGVRVTRGDMNKGTVDRGWRLKGHADDPFWRWVASWARAMRKPSDYGFSDDGFILPKLVERSHMVAPNTPHPDHLFETPAIGLQEERAEIRRTLDERCESAAQILDGADRAVAWCHLNDESATLTRLIDGAVEVTGSDSDEAKEEKLTAFSRGEVRVLVTKPKIGAWGLNWQHCHRMTYFPSHSYEQYYQAVRRSWRFGQTEPVEVDLVTTPGGERIMRNLHRKAEHADQMFARLIDHMNDALRIDDSTPEQEMELPSWVS